MWRGKQGRKEGSGDGGKEERVVRPSGCHLDPTYMSPKRWSLERRRAGGSGGRLETWQRRPRSSRVDKKLKLLRCHSTSPADRPKPSLPPSHKCRSPSLGGRHSCSKKCFRMFRTHFFYFRSRDQDNYADCRPFCSTEDILVLFPGIIS